MIKRSTNRYRRNPAVRGNLRWGRRCLDGQSGFPTWERRLIMDEWGNMVDPRYGGYDLKDDKSQGEVIR